MKIPVKFFFSVALRFSTVLSGLGAFLISSYLYGPEGRGAIAFVTSFYASLGLFLSFGMGRIMYQKITLQIYSVEDIQRTAMRFIHLVSGVVLAGALIGSLLRPDLLQFLLFFGFFVSCLWLSFSNYLYSAAQRTHVHDRVIFITRLLQPTILLLAIPLKLGLHEFMLLYGLTCIGVYVVEALSLARLKDSRKLAYRQSLQMMHAILKEVKWSYIESLGATLGSIVPFLMGLYVSKEDLGNYNFAMQILVTLYFPFLILQVKLQEQLGNVDEQRAKTIIKKSLFAVVLGSIPLMASIYVIPVVIRFVHLSRFEEAMVILKSLILTIPLFGIIYSLQGVWVGIHRVRFSALLNLQGSFVTLFCTFLMVKSLGIQAAINATYISYIVSITIGIVFLRRNWNRLLENKR